MRSGFYVEGRYFAANQAQAQAYAMRVSRESKRPVKIDYLAPTLGVITFDRVDAGVRP